MLHDHKGATRPLDDSAVYHAVCLDVTHEQTIDLHSTLGPILILHIEFAVNVVFINTVVCCA